MLNEFFLKTLGEEGKRLNIPANKNRALIREYLQTRIIAYLYGKEGASKISFIGGTSLRLLRGLDRFSEDLDFDNLNLTSKQIEILFQDISSQLNREGFEAYCTIKNKSGSGINPTRQRNAHEESHPDAQRPGTVPALGHAAALVSTAAG